MIPHKYAEGRVRQGSAPYGVALQTPAAISSVSDRSPAALRELQRLGLVPGAVLTIEQRNAASSLSVKLRNGGDPIRVSLDLADCISVIAPAA